jgi:hypothetical protein
MPVICGFVYFCQPCLVSLPPPHLSPLSNNFERKCLSTLPILPDSWLGPYTDWAFSQVVGIRSPPTPHPQAGSPGSGGGAHSRAREGLGESQFRREGTYLWYSLYIRTLWGRIYCLVLSWQSSRSLKIPTPYLF